MPVIFHKQVFPVSAFMVSREFLRCQEKFFFKSGEKTGFLPLFRGSPPKIRPPAAPEPVS
jgi:hypothetical protein